MEVSGFVASAALNLEQVDECSVMATRTPAWHQANQTRNVYNESKHKLLGGVSVGYRRQNEYVYTYILFGTLSAELVSGVTGFLWGLPRPGQVPAVSRCWERGPLGLPRGDSGAPSAHHAPQSADLHSAGRHPVCDLQYLLSEPVGEGGRQPWHNPVRCTVGSWRRVPPQVWLTLEIVLRDIALTKAAQMLTRLNRL